MKPCIDQSEIAQLHDHLSTEKNRKSITNAMFSYAQLMSCLFLGPNRKRYSQRDCIRCSAGYDKLGVEYHLSISGC